jgi:hypothetical protein
MPWLRATSASVCMADSHCSWLTPSSGMAYIPSTPADSQACTRQAMAGSVCHVVFCHCPLCRGVLLCLCERCTLQAPAGKHAQVWGACGAPGREGRWLSVHAGGDLES